MPINTVPVIANAPSGLSRFSTDLRAPLDTSSLRASTSRCMRLVSILALVSRRDWASESLYPGSGLHSVNRVWKLFSRAKQGRRQHLCLRSNNFLNWDVIKVCGYNRCLANKYSSLARKRLLEQLLNTCNPCMMIDVLPSEKPIIKATGRPR